MGLLFGLDAEAGRLKLTSTVCSLLKDSYSTPLYGTKIIKEAGRGNKWMIVVAIEQSSFG